MSVKSREDANKYYNQINKLVDEYTETHKIRPSRLGKYLKPGSDRSKRFLKRNNLSDVVGADRILGDIIEDRVNMESDGVLTFENYKYFESNDFKIDSLKDCLYKGMDKSDKECEKALSDHFDVNLSDITQEDKLDPSKHKYKLSDWGNDDWEVVIYSDEEYDLIKSNIIEHLYEQLSEKEVELIKGIEISLSKIINKENFEEKMNSFLTESKLNEIIANCLGEDWSFESKFSRESKSKVYYIWIC